MKTLFLIFIHTLLMASDLPVMKDQVGIPEVFQREYIQTNSKIHPYIQTYGLITCVALIIYDPSTSHTILAHLDSQTNLEEEIPWLFTGFGERSNLQIFLAGGEFDQAENLMDRVILYLKKQEISIDKVIRPMSSKGMSIAFKLSSGELFKYNEMFLDTSYGLLDAKLNRLHYGGSRLFRHDDSLGGGDSIELDESVSKWDFLLQ